MVRYGTDDVRRFGSQHAPCLISTLDVWSRSKLSVSVRLVKHPCSRKSKLQRDDNIIVAPARLASVRAPNLRSQGWVLQHGDTEWQWPVYRTLPNGVLGASVMTAKARSSLSSWCFASATPVDEKNSELNAMLPVASASRSSAQR